MESRAVIGRRRACLHVPRVRGTTFKPGGRGRRALGGSRGAAAAGRGGGGFGGRGGGGGPDRGTGTATGKALGRDPTGGPMEVAAGGGCGAGPPLLLSESEQQCYSELFARCAGAASGGPGPGPPEATRVAPSTATAAAGPVADLFRASQLPPETLHQVCLCALLSLAGLWGRCLWKNGATTTIPGDLEGGGQGGKKGGCCAAEDGGDALVPRDSSLFCSSPPHPVLGCALRPLRESSTPVVSGGSSASQTQSLPCSGSDVCFGCCLL